MTRKLKITLSAVIAALAVTGAVLGFALADGSAPRPLTVHHVVPSAHAATAPMAPAAVCASLSKSPAPLTTYALMVIRETTRVAGLNPTPADARKAKAHVAERVRESCPRFAYLITQYSNTR